MDVKLLEQYLAHNKLSGMLAIITATTTALTSAGSSEETLMQIYL